ncbi:hypothetical protein PuT2_11970 [Pusillimonas sp. T2]|uniref:ParB/RepB/Spo0J family partition protein n=1 Tax=Pusillimonas sp. T2 TaxID=1548123 RepID=UPI000B9CD0AF|nr:ParB/RepB/Spo0J family partition protein [Pusillimonas sp. T2]OXR48677.1 hypothetical protein PuT2_11970 [Pusillimonas sp. T2]
MSKNRFEDDADDPINVAPKPAVDPFDRAAQTLKEKPFPFDQAFDTRLTSGKKVQESTATRTQSVGETVAVPTSGAGQSNELAAVYMEVDLELIDDNPFNARAIYLPEKIAEKAADIKLRGQLVPGLAMRKGDRFQLIAGHYRRRALPLAGLKTMKLMVYPQLSTQQLYVLSYKENAEANPQTPLDNAIRWKSLLQEKVFGSELEIAESISMSKANVNKTMQILNLPAQVLEILEQNPGAFALSTLYEIVLLHKVAGEREACMAAESVLSNGWGRKDVADRRTIFENKGATPRRRNETSRQYKILDGDDKIGAIKEWDNGKVVLEVNSLDPEKRIKIVEELKRLFAVGD